MLKRNENGKLRFTHQYDLDIMFGNLFDKCKTVEELDWVYGLLTESLDLMHEERTDKLEVEL